MPSKIFHSRTLPLVASALLLLSGCSLSPIAKHTVEFSAATAVVVDSSIDAYRGAVRLRQSEQVLEAVYAYDQNPAWNPHQNFKPLLTPDQLQARIKVLDALKAYAGSLVELTSAKPSKALATDATAAGTNLRTLNQSVATSFASAGVPVISDTEAKAVSTAVFALAEFLTRAKVKAALPKITAEMNPSVLSLCDLLHRDIATLRRQADVDYQTLLTNEDEFIRHKTLSAVEHRNEVGTLITLAQQQRANDELLKKLQSAIQTLADTHQALDAAAHGHDPESLRLKLADLAAAGQDLGSFYASLPAS